MGFFEANPWVLIPIIVITVEAWFAFKKFIRTRVLFIDRKRR